MPEKKTDKKVEMNKISSKQYASLKGRLVEVRKAGSMPFFIDVLKNDTIKKACEKADVDVSDDELKVEGIKIGGRNWQTLKMTDKAFEFGKLSITTNVEGAN
jgi:hypothetical protein